MPNKILVVDHEPAKLDHVLVAKLDVTDPESIRSAVTARGEVLSYEMREIGVPVKLEGRWG